MESDLLASKKESALSHLSFEALIEEILQRIGEDSSRDGLLRTPERVRRTYEFLTQGYRESISDIINHAVFDVEYNEMVVVKNIDYYSLCEHHMLPFFGKAHVAYIPGEKVLGLSKIPRLIEHFSRRLQVQERMTNQIAETLMHYLNPQGVGVVIEGQHLCMQMRGVQKQNSVAVTSAMLGCFQSGPTRAELFSVLRMSGASL
jgi:GTP cyclohydrolase I